MLFENSYNGVFCIKGGNLTVEVKIKRLTNNAKLPTIAYDSDLGIDLYTTHPVYLRPGAWVPVSTGIAIETNPPVGFLIKERSSLAFKYGIFCIAGVIDPGYRGEIKIILASLSTNHYLSAGSKVAQLIPILPVKFLIKEVQELSETERNTKGFGSSGD